LKFFHISIVVSLKIRLNGIQIPKQEWQNLWEIIDFLLHKMKLKPRKPMVNTMLHGMTELVLFYLNSS
jgi:hypothetical protein